jgi:hypothetical protein
MPECPDCSSFYGGRKCACGYAPPKLGTINPSEGTGPMLCPLDGAILGDLGYCHKGQGYPFTIPCPFVCPLCRGALDWTGGCGACHGTNTGERSRWSFPGDGYYTHDPEGRRIGDGKHYVKQQGPRPAAEKAVNSESANMIARILGNWGAA